jgi:hypothetical protein
VRTRLVAVAAAVVLGGLGIALPVIASASGGDAPATVPTVPTTTVQTSKPAQSTTRISVPVAVEQDPATTRPPVTALPEDTTWAPRPPLPTTPGPTTSVVPEITPLPVPVTTTPPVPVTTDPSTTTVVPTTR